MKELYVARPTYAILLTDLVLYLVALKDRRPDLAERARQAIQGGRYYEQN